MTYNPQNEMFLTFQTNRSFLKNETASKEHKKIAFSGNKKSTGKYSIPVLFYYLIFAQLAKNH